MTMNSKRQVFKSEEKKGLIIGVKKKTTLLNLIKMVMN